MANAALKAWEWAREVWKAAAAVVVAAFVLGSAYTTLNARHEDAMRQITEIKVQVQAVKKGNEVLGIVEERLRSVDARLQRIENQLDSMLSRFR